MIYFDTKSNQYKFHALYASFLDSNKRQVKPTSDRSHWEQMVGKWGHLENLSFTAIAPSAEQESRLNTINNTPEALDAMYSYDVGMYVQHNGVSKDNEAPFLEQFRTQETEDNFLAAVKEDIKDDVRHYRWVQETSGIQINGIPVKTNQSSQDKISKVALRMMADPSVEYIDFEISKGVWKEITRDVLMLIAVTVDNHVQQCFTKCKNVHASIDAMSYEELEDFDIETAWQNA